MIWQMFSLQFLLENGRSTFWHYPWHSTMSQHRFSKTEMRQFGASGTDELKSIRRDANIRRVILRCDRLDYNVICHINSFIITNLGRDLSRSVISWSKADFRGDELDELWYFKKKYVKNFNWWNKFSPKDIQMCLKYSLLANLEEQLFWANCLFLSRGRWS